MKKLICLLGVSSLLVLASCSSTSVKKPNKGKTVDNINIQYRTSYNELDNLELDSSMSFKEAYNRIKYVYFEMTQDNNSFGFNKKYIEKETLKATNYIYDDYCLIENNYYNLNNSITYDGYFKRTPGERVGSNADFYYLSKDKTEVNGNLDDYKCSVGVYSEKGFAGTEFSSNQEYSTDSCKYTISKTNGKAKEKYKNEVTNEKTELYQYVNEKSDVDNLDKTHYGYDKDGERYMYSLATFVNTSSIFDTNISKDFYDEEYDEFYDNKISLTDKYIILNIKSKYTKYMYDDAIDQLSLETGKSFFDTSEVISKLRTLIDECYTDSYKEIEVWLDYTKPYDPSDESIKKLSFSYYKKVESNNCNKKGKFDARYLNHYHNNLSSDLLASLIGLDFTNEYKLYKEVEVSINYNSYNNKIKKMKNKCKKNNIFSKIKMYED